MYPLYLKKWFKKKDIYKHQKLDKDMSCISNEEQIKNDTTIGKMAAFFAHEIRNPLTSIIGFSQHLEKHPIIKADPNISAYISIIKEEAYRMEILIQELLNLSKYNYENDHLSIIDVKHSIEKMITIYSRQASDNNIFFRLELMDNVFISGNSERFERVLINLINNALDAVEQDGMIKIVMEKEDPFVKISIIDDGPGIPEESLNRIFYPFYTTKSEGTGIGLPICKTIVETLGGAMTVQNHLPHGIHVTLKIPISNETS